MSLIELNEMEAAVYEMVKRGIPSAVLIGKHLTKSRSYVGKVIRKLSKLGMVRIEGTDKLLTYHAIEYTYIVVHRNHGKIIAGSFKALRRLVSDYGADLVRYVANRRHNATLEELERKTGLTPNQIGDILGRLGA